MRAYARTHITPFTASWPYQIQHEEVDYAELCTRMQAQLASMEAEFRQRHQEQQQRYEDVIRQLAAQVQQYQIQQRREGEGRGDDSHGGDRQGGIRSGSGGGMRAEARMDTGSERDEPFTNQVRFLCI